MQCASSMAMQSTFRSASRARVRGARSASGAMYRSFTPFPLSFVTFARYSSRLRELFRKRAGTPYSLSWSTWSFIREMSGDTTIVRPSKINPGI